MTIAMTGNDTSTPHEDTATPKGRPDLSGLSTDKLRDLLQAELQRRESAGQPDASAVAVPGRFSRRDGLVGWLESVRRKQPLYGRGSIGADASTVTLCGWQRTWLGVPMERALLIAAERVCNVARIGTGVYLEIVRRGWFSRKVFFEPDPGFDVGALLARLPVTKTSSFTAKRQDLLLFERALRSACPRAWVTPLLVLLNVIAFGTLVVATGVIIGLGYSPIAFSYGNVPSLVLAGEWWRLATALFVHRDLLHLALNMWALWSIGRLTERLFGQGRYLGIYLMCGIIAGVVSIAWDPASWSIGASGAIFGVFGAFVAYLAHPATHVPRAIMRAHWVPTLLFVIFNLLAGTFQDGIDNAAHVGGLLTGFALGIALMPLPANTRSMAVRSARFAALVLLVGGIAGALGFGRVLDRQLSLAEQFAVDHPWYTPDEGRNLVAWQRLAGMAASGMISTAQLADGFRTDVQPFWEDAHARLLRAVPGEREDQRGLSPRDRRARAAARRLGEGDHRCRRWRLARRREGR